MSILSKFYHAKNYGNIVFLLFEIAASDRFKSLAIKDAGIPSLISKQIR